MGFVVPGKWADKRHDGQVPNREQQIERAGIMKLVSQPAPPFNVDRLFDRPVLSAGAAVDDLGLSKADQNSWSKFLGDVVGGATYEPAVRQQVMERLLQEDWDPTLRKIVLQRSVQLYRDTRKSIVSVDQLKKAQDAVKARERESLEKAEGGMYHRRVPTKSKDGKKRYKYYYNPESYNASKDAHHSGDDIRSNAIRGDVDKAVQAAGHEGCDANTMRRLAKKYGRAEMAEHLKGACKKGSIVYKGKRFYLGKGK